MEWNHEGTMFQVKSWRAMRKEVFSRYFTCHWQSFLKYFLRYGFTLKDGYYYHEYFTRANPRLELIKKSAGIQQQKVKKVRKVRKVRKNFPQPARITETEPLPFELEPQLSLGEPVCGYSLNADYFPLEPGQIPCFLHRDKYIPADSGNLKEYSMKADAVPYLLQGNQRKAIPGALFLLSDPRKSPPATYRVLGYLENEKWTMLLPGDVVVYVHKGQWCSVLTETDVQLAQHSESRTYVARQGEYLQLPPGTLLYFIQEKVTLVPTLLNREPRVVV